MYFILFCIFFAPFVNVRTWIRVIIIHQLVPHVRIMWHWQIWLCHLTTQKRHIHSSYISVNLQFIYHMWKLILVTLNRNIDVNMGNATDLAGKGDHWPSGNRSLNKTTLLITMRRTRSFIPYKDVFMITENNFLILFVNGILSHLLTVSYSVLQIDFEMYTIHFLHCQWVYVLCLFVMCTYHLGHRSCRLLPSWTPECFEKPLSCINSSMKFISYYIFIIQNTNCLCAAQLNYFTRNTTSWLNLYFFSCIPKPCKNYCWKWASACSFICFYDCYLNSLSTLLTNFLL